MLVQCRALSFKYGKKTVYDNFNWDLSAGSVCGLIGPNGAGKTTMFKLLSGLIFRKDGQIQVLGHDPQNREAELYQKLSYVAETLACPSMSPLDYVQLIGPLYPYFSLEKFYDLAERFEVDMQLDFSALSAGDLRKAWLSIVLSLKTRLILLDEPSKGLDIHSQGVLRKVLTETAADGSSIVLSTHHVREVESILDFVTLIDREGQLRLNSKTEDLYQHYSVTSYYSKEAIPHDALAYQCTPSAWTALFPKASEAYNDISLELLFTGLCRNEKEVTDDSH